MSPWDSTRGMKHVLQKGDCDLNFVLQIFTQFYSCSVTLRSKECGKKIKQWLKICIFIRLQVILSTCQLGLPNLS